MSEYLPDAVLAHLKAVADLPDLSQTRYEMLRLLGRGGMGSVYLVFDPLLQRQAALKVIEEGDAAEAQVMAGLEHPGIVPVHDAGLLPDGRSFYVMRYVEGRRLDEFRRARPPLLDRLQVFERICEAVAFAHHRQAAHRDLKPDNIIVGAYGEVFVLDWGVALGLDADPALDLAALGRLLAWLLDEGDPRPLRAIAGHPYPRTEDLLADLRRYRAQERVLAYRESPAEALGRFVSRNRVLLLLLATYTVVKAVLYFLHRS
jgi:serine/threonine protein kinase